MSSPLPSLQSYLPTRTLLRLLAVQALVLLPHAVRLPLWESAAVIAVLLWRSWAAFGHRTMPGKLLRAALTLAAFASVYASYGRVTGQNAGVALLVIMAALKLTELSARRDVMVSVFLMYFLCVTHFLFSQEIWTLAYLLACTVATTAVLIDSQHPGDALPLKTTLRLSGVLVAQAIPLMVLMFVLFPRIPGPLWGLPSDAGAGRSGLSNHMSPGDISGLILSDELAFRVRFDGPAPPPNQRYWRGPVFWNFDGREWTEGDGYRQDSATISLQGPAIRYEVVLEPNRTRWLFALELPDPRQLPPAAQLTPDAVLLAGELIKSRQLYRLSSHPHHQLQLQLPDRARRAALALPEGRNPKAVALARGWRAQGLSDAAIVATALQQFTQQPFYYSLRPPPLGRQPVDEFLFSTRKGFCEHYASSFTVLMRAAGIPARVVTGYQGGQFNPRAGHYVIRQSDAHAWSEVWLPNVGWQRVDPTAAVAPNRIEKNLADALDLSEQVSLGMQRSNSGTLIQLQQQWDSLNAQWDRWVLAYGPDSQQALLSRIGLSGWRDLMLSLTAALAIALSSVGLYSLYRARAIHPSDPALRAWQRALKPLAQQGLIQRANEGPEAFIQRAIETLPAQTAPLTELLQAYVGLRYLAAGNPAVALKQMAQLGQHLRKAR